MLAAAVWSRGSVSLVQIPQTLNGLLLNIYRYSLFCCLPLGLFPEVLIGGVLGGLPPAPIFSDFTGEWVIGSPYAVMPEIDLRTLPYAFSRQTPHRGKTGKP